MFLTSVYSSWVIHIISPPARSVERSQSFQKAFNLLSCWVITSGRYTRGNFGCSMMQWLRSMLPLFTSPSYRRLSLNPPRKETSPAWNCSLSDWNKAQLATWITATVAESTVSFLGLGPTPKASPSLDWNKFRNPGWTPSVRPSAWSYFYL